LSLPKALVDYLNSLRKENGIPSVNYANSGTSNLRARYMLDHNLFSHYDLEGVHPGYYFTKTSNYYGGEESIGMTFYGRPVLRDGVQVMREAKRILYRMLYEDEESNWGHRDSLLDPCFNYSDISVAWDSRRIFVVVTMISAWVDWVIDPQVTGQRLQDEGQGQGDVPHPRAGPEGRAPSRKRLQEVLYTGGGRGGSFSSRNLPGHRDHQADEMGVGEKSGRGVPPGPGEGTDHGVGVGERPEGDQLESPGTEEARGV
jgi:hypothetical protein